MISRSAVSVILCVFLELTLASGAQTATRSHLRAQTADAHRSEEALTTRSRSQREISARVDGRRSWLTANVLLAQGRLVSVAQRMHLIKTTAASQEEQPDAQVDFYSTMMGFVAVYFWWFVFILILGFLYQQKVLRQEPLKLEQFEGEDFKHGPCDCFEEPKICLMSFCCGFLRWSDNMYSLGIMSFWAAILFVFFMDVIEILTSPVGWLITAFTFFMFRQHIRKQLDMRNSNEDKAKDLFLWCFCAPCALAQEARQIEDMAERASGAESKAETA